MYNSYYCNSGNCLETTYGQVSLDTGEKVRNPMLVVILNLNER